MLGRGSANDLSTPTCLWEARQQVEHASVSNLDSLLASVWLWASVSDSELSLPLHNGDTCSPQTVKGGFSEVRDVETWGAKQPTVVSIKQPTVEDSFLSVFSEVQRFVG